MRRWNGWGDEDQDFPLNAGAIRFLQHQIGPGKPLPDAGLAEVLASVPTSRLPVSDLYSTDAELRVRHARGQSLPDWLALHSGEINHFPDAVARPESAEEIRALLHLANERKINLIPYGGGTSVVGHINPIASQRPNLTISLANFNCLNQIDTISNLASFGAGTSGPQVEAQLKPHGYLLGHYPQSWELSTLGGWVASRSSGQQSLRYGRIEQLFAGARIETCNGTLDIPTFPASAAGPDIKEMILGSEGRLGIITDVTVKITPLPQHESFHVIFFPDQHRALAALRELAQQRVPLSMMRLSNPKETWTQLQLAGHPHAIAVLERYLRLRGAKSEKCMFTFGISGSKTVCNQLLRQLRQSVRHYDGIDTGQLLGKKWQQTRFRSPYLRQSLWQQGYAADTVETAVDWVRVAPAMNAVESALNGCLKPYGEKVLVFTHLSHIYSQGSSLYTTYVFRCGNTYADTLSRWQQLKAAASEAILANQGTISHQHGVGLDHARYLAAEKGHLGLSAIAALCRQFDPNQIMNPGKLITMEPDREQAD